MALYQDLKKKIPARMQTREFKIFQSLIKKKSLNNYDKLRDYLERRQKDLQDWIKKNTTSSTMNRWMSRKKNELDFIHFVRKNFLRYLR